MQPALEVDEDGQLVGIRLAISRDRKMSIQIRPQPLPRRGFYDLPEVRDALLYT